MVGCGWCSKKKKIVDHQQIKKLTGFMIRRLMTVIEKNGDYTVLVRDLFSFLISEMFTSFLFIIITLTDGTKQMRWEFFSFFI